MFRQLPGHQHPPPTPAPPAQHRSLRNARFLTLLAVVIGRAARRLDEKVIHVLGRRKSEILGDLAHVPVGVQQHPLNAFKPPPADLVLDAAVN